MENGRRMILECHTGTVHLPCGRARFALTGPALPRPASEGRLPLMVTRSRWKAR